MRPRNSVPQDDEEVGMRYWVTTHWPPRKDNASDGHEGVWLPNGREAAGASLAVGDHVIVYESRSGRTAVRHRPDGTTRNIRCREGHEGVVCYGAISEPLHALSDDESESEHYADGTAIWWRWFAPLKILSRSGFVSRPELALSLGYNRNWNFRGFGTLHSGLIEITREKYHDIVSKFHATRPLRLPSYTIPYRGTRHGGAGESSAHENLKRYVAANPGVALREPGLRTVGIEYPFPTGDRADVVMADSFERAVAVEVETAVGDSDLAGPLQAIKYRFMLEWIAGREPGDSRAILVAHEISEGMRGLCSRYGVQCVQIPEVEVLAASPTVAD